jgi:glucokinase
MSSNNDSEKKYVISLDLGGTNSTFGVVNKNGEILRRINIGTQTHDNAEDYFQDCIEALNPLIQEFGRENILAMGIGAPNANYLKGTIENAVNISWCHTCIVPICQKFSEKLGNLPCFLTNDAKAAALGEKNYGIAKGMKDFIMITLGTGFGSGIIVNGQVVYGHDGCAGELGHMCIDFTENARLCPCGKKGCIEAYASAKGMLNTTMELLNKQPEVESKLRDLREDEMNAYEIYLAAKKGDIIANKVFEITGDLIGKACANFSLFSSPEAFIFFGSLSESKNMLLPIIELVYNNNVMKVFRNKAKFLLSGIKGNDAILLGAAALAWEELEKKK